MSRKSALACVIMVVVSGRLALAQPGSPVYPDDSPSAAAALSATSGMIASGNADEAVRTLQGLLDESGDRVVGAIGDEALFVSARGEVHRQLLAEPELMTRYRASQGGRAQALLDEGKIEEVERAYLLTSAGYEAALRLCQMRIESARFHAAFITLAQLESHPDRVGDLDAVNLAVLIARYDPRDEVIALAKRWGAELDAGDVELTPFDRPVLADIPTLTPLTEGEALIAQQIPPAPMWSVPLDNDGSLAMTGSSNRPPRERRVGLWTNPTIAGDVLFVNDTVWVRAWDRYTLEPLWRVKPGIGGPLNPQTLNEAWEQRTANTVGHVQIEDTNSVSVWAHVAVTATGFAKDNNRLGDSRVHGLDVRTGKTLWSASPGTGNNPLDVGTVRGPILVDEGTAVVAVRRSARTRRVVSYSLVGLDALSGKTLWTRPIGSAGALPFANDRQIANSCVLDRGVVYASDQMGVIAAIEVETGRPIWVRRIGVSEIASGSRTAAWQSISPIVHGDVVYMLTPTRDRIVMIDRHSGNMLAWRPTDRFGMPQYIVRAGDSLAAIGASRVAVIPFSEFESGSIRLSERLAPDEIRGRVVAAGGKLYVPTSNGVLEIDPLNPREPTQFIALDHPGTALPAGEQIVVVDDHAVHAYVTWGVADRVLQARMDAEPGLAAPAVSYADLAYRVGRTAQIVPAVDRAIEALELRPNDPANVAARSRLFASLQSMATDWLVSAPEAKRMAATLTAVTERLGRVANSSAQQVDYLLVHARMLESQGDFAAAAETFGGVLQRAELARIEIPQNGRRMTAAGAATLEIQKLVLDHGAAAYDGMEAQAAAALAAIGTGVDPEALTSFARRYPATNSASKAWSRAAELFHDAGQRQNEITSLRQALLSSEIVNSLEGNLNSTPVELAVSRLIAALNDANRQAEAALIFARALNDLPAMKIDGAEGAAALKTQQQLALPRGARIGSTLTGAAQSIPGWTIMPTLVADGDRGSSHILLRSASEREFSLWGPIEAAADLRRRAASADGPGSLAMLWTRAFLDFEPLVVRVDPDALYLLWATERGGEIEKIRTFDGMTLWRTEPFNTLFKPDGAFAGRLTNRLRNPIAFHTPTNIQRMVADLVVAADSDSVVLVERSGRLAVFDPETGALVRTQVSSVQTVFDVDVSGGLVAITGSAQAPHPDSMRVPTDPAIAVFDARTGEFIGASNNGLGNPAWVRVVDNDAVVAGSSDSLACFEFRTGQIRWAASDAQGDAAAPNTMAGWIFGETLFVLGGSGQVTARSPKDGRPLAIGSLMGSGRFGRFDVRAHPVSKNRFVFLSGGGVVVIDEKGMVVGMDSIDAARRVGILRPALGEAKVVAVERATNVGDAQGRGINRVHFISASSGELLGSRDVAIMNPPTRVALLDGHVAISTAAMTIVYATDDDESVADR